MRNRYFTPRIESMEFRFTPSGAGSAAIVANSATASDSSSDSGGIDYTGQTGVDVPVFSTSTTVPDAFSPGGDDDGIDFSGQSGVYVPVFN